MFKNMSLCGGTLQLLTEEMFDLYYHIVSFCLCGFFFFTFMYLSTSFVHVALVPISYYDHCVGLLFQHRFHALKPNLVLVGAPKRCLSSIFLGFVLHL